MQCDAIKKNNKPRRVI